MKGLEVLAEEVRNIARADVLKLMADEGKAAKAFEDFAAAPDESIDFVARMSGVPEHQFPVYRAMVRREENEYSSKIAELSGILQTGDVILVTGKNLNPKPWWQPRPRSTRKPGQATLQWCTRMWSASMPTWVSASSTTPLQRY